MTRAKHNPSKAEILNKVYTATNHEDLMDAYVDWAGDYDRDTVDEFGYVAHVAGARALDRFTDDTGCRILDAGCGTGLVAEVLRKMGYERLEGLDYSREMLDVARDKGVYEKTMHADLSKPLDIPDDHYDAVVCVGTFTYGHVGAEAFDHLVRVTRPGGHVCFTIRDGAYEEFGYRERMLEMEEQGAWELVEMRDEDYLRNEGVQCKLCTYQVR